MSNNSLPDFTVSNQGSIFLVTPLNDTARDWLEENISEDSQYLGRALAVEHRYIENLLQGLQNEGFNVSEI